MGLADMLIKMGIRYGSKESIKICDLIGFEMTREAILTSNVLSKINKPMWIRQVLIPGIIQNIMQMLFQNLHLLLSIYHIKMNLPSLI